MKKALSLALALALSLSLAIPALAEEAPMSTEEGLAPISLELEEEDCAKIDRTETIYKYDWMALVVQKEQLDWFYAVKDGTEITVTHNGSDPSSFIYIYLNRFTKSSESNVVEYWDGEDPEKTYTTDFAGKYFGQTYYSTYLSRGRGTDEEHVYSVADGSGKYWNEGYYYFYLDGSTGEVRFDNSYFEPILLYPGDSVAFTLPKDGTDSLYRLYTAIYYPQYDWSYWNWYVFKTDDALAASAAPAEPEQPSAPAQPEQPAAPSGISVTVGDKAVEWTDAAPFIDANSRTMVPLRAVADAMSLTVNWDGDAREASFSDGSKTIYFPIDSTSARTSDGGAVQMDTAAVIVNERTYAPIRYLAEYFGYTVGWDGETQTVSLTK